MGKNKSKNRNRNRKKSYEAKHELQLQVGTPSLAVVPSRCGITKEDDEIHTLMMIFDKSNFETLPEEIWIHIVSFNPKEDTSIMYAHLILQAEEEEEAVDKEVCDEYKDLRAIMPDDGPYWCPSDDDYDPEPDPSTAFYIPDDDFGPREEYDDYNE